MLTAVVNANNLTLDVMSDLDNNTTTSSSRDDDDDDVMTSLSDNNNVSSGMQAAARTATDPASMWLSQLVSNDRLQSLWSSSQSEYNVGDSILARFIQQVKLGCLHIFIRQQHQ